MAESAPSHVTWSEHALVKAHLFGYARSDVEGLILTGHDRRRRNTGAADWLVVAGRLVVAYTFPGTDELTAHVVTLWRRA
jgi:hypothetical protein